MRELAVFGYASLVAVDSTAETLGRPVPQPSPARLLGWRRRWSQARDNRRSEKSFGLADGFVPPFVLALNLERTGDDLDPVNGAVFEVTEAELDRLDVREIRYDRVDVTELIEMEGQRPDNVIAYTAKPANFAPAPPPGAVILSTYAAAIERAFRELGAGELEAYHTSTGPHPVELVEARLIDGEIPRGNPRAW